MGEDRELAVRCGKHGPMAYRPDLNLWACPGWDGEGCETECTDATVRRLREAAARSPSAESATAVSPS